MYRYYFPIFLLKKIPHNHQENLMLVNLMLVFCNVEQCGFRKARGCMDQVFAVRQVCENYLPNGNMYSGRLWVWKRHMIRSIGMVCGRCQECMELDENC